jgi:hypothetical protein
MTDVGVKYDRFLRTSVIGGRESGSRGVGEMNIQLSKNREAVATEHLAARVAGFGHLPLRGRLKAIRTSI